MPVSYALIVIIALLVKGIRIVEADMRAQVPG
jgi:hypothetical protein